jgi:alpha-tubulin suppressor-like RCC1 family protein
MKRIMRNFYLLAVFALVAGWSNAAVFTVTNSNDAGAGSLRQAIIDANGTVGAHTINFDAATDGVPIILTTGSLPNVTRDVNFTGNGYLNTIVDGGGTTQTFVESTDWITWSVDGLTIRNFNFGAIISSHNNSVLTVTNCLIENIVSPFIQAPITFQGTNLTVDNCSFDSNASTNWAGCIELASTVTTTNLTVTNTSFTNNSGRTGAIHSVNIGLVTLTNCSFINNTGNIFGTISGDILPGSSITNCTFSGNTSTAGNSGGIETSNADWNWDIVNSIIANNAPFDVYYAGSNVVGSTTNSIVEACDMPAATCPAWFSTADPLLGAPTTCGLQTYLTPGAGSLAIDNGTGGPVNDICGNPYGTPDIGSVALAAPIIGAPACQVLPDAQGQCLEVIGNYMYMGHWQFVGPAQDAMISIYDISVPGTATYIGSENHGQGGGLGNGILLDLETDGTYLYSAARNREEFYVIDYSNPIDLNVIGTALLSPTPSAIPEALKVNGTNVFVVDNWGKLYTIDVSTPAAPVVTNTLVTGGNPTDIEISGTVAYLANTTGLEVYDITNPNAPALLTTITDAASYFRVYRVGTTLYAANGADLYTYDISTPTAPVLQGAPLTLTNAIYSFDLNGSELYVGTNAGAGAVGALTLLDISTPTTPTLVDESPLDAHRGREIVYDNGFVYSVDDFFTEELCIYGAGAPVIIVNNDHYWVGGPGDWSDAANHWADASGGVPGSTTVPQAGDNAIFDDNSGLTAADVVNIDVDANVDSLIYNTMSNTFVFNNSGFETRIENSWLGSASGVTFTGTWGEIVFDADSAGESITSGGTTFLQDFRIVGDSAITLVDDLDITTGTMFVDTGGVVVNGNNMSVSNLTSNTTSQRNIDISNSTVNVTQGSWIVDATGLTFDATTSLINLNDNAGLAVFTGGALPYDTIRSLSATTLDYSDNNTSTWFEIVTSSQLNITNGDTLSTDTLIAAGICGAPTVFTTTGVGVNGNINNTGASDLDLTNIVVNGVDAVAPGNYTLRLSDTTNALGWTLGSTNFYWVNDAGNWNDGTHWAFTSGGPGSGCIPTLSDSTFFDANSFSAGGFTVAVQDTAFFRSMDWTGTTGAQTLALDSSLWAHGDVTFSPNVSVVRTSVQSSLTFFQVGELDAAGAPLVDLAINIIPPSANDTLFLMNDLLMTDTSSISLFNGVLATQNNNVYMGSFTSVDNPLETTDARELILGSSTVELTNQFFADNDANLTVTPGTSHLIIGDTLGFPNNLITEGLTFNDVTLDYAPTSVSLGINGNTVQGSNTYNKLTIVPGSEVFLASGDTQTVSDTLFMRGNCIDSIWVSTLDTTSFAVTNIFKDIDSAAVQAECLNLTGIAATGFGITAFFSSNLGSNTGITFDDTASVQAIIGIDSTLSNFCLGDTITFTNNSESFYTPFNQLNQEWFIGDGSFPLFDSTGIIEADKANIVRNGVHPLGEHESTSLDSLLSWNEISDISNLFDPVTGEATTLAGSDFLVYNFSVGYRIRLTNNSADTAFLVDMDDSTDIVRYRYRPTFRLQQGTNTVTLTPANHSWRETDTLEVGDTIIANNFINFSMTSPTLTPTETISVLAGLTVDSLGFPTKPRWKDGDSTTANDIDVSYDFFIDTIHIEVLPGTNGLDTTSFATVLQTSGNIPVSIEVQDPVTQCIARDTLLVDVINPSINLLSSEADLAICPEDSVVFEASSSSPDSLGVVSFEFFVNGVSQSAPTPPSPNDTLLTLFNMSNNDTVSVLAYQAGCTSDTMPSFIFTVFDSPVFNFTSSDADTTICDGDFVSFSAWSADSLNTFAYQINGVGVSPIQDSLATYSTSSLVDGDDVFVIATDSNSCVDTLNMVFTVDSLPTVLLTESSGGNLICENEPVTFTASGSDTYEFFLDGVSLGAPSAVDNITLDTLEFGDTITVRGINSNGCEQFSANSFTYFVTPLPNTSLVSSDADSSICSFENVTFTASNATVYEFFINSTSVQGPSTNSVFAPPSLVNSDTITVVGTTGGCSFESSEIVMEVLTAPTTTISNDDVGGDNIICAGTPVTFTSTGAATYEFLIDGVPVQGPSAVDTFITSGLTNGQVVTVNGVSNTCTVSQSQTFTVLINPIVQLFSNDADNIICEGDPIIFTGSNAANYEFFVDGISVQGPSSDFTLNNPAIAAGPHVVTVVGTAGNGCPDESPAINLTVNAIPTISLSSSDPNDTICAGETVVFTGSGGDAYQFFVNGTPQGSLSATPTFATSNLLNNQTVTVNGSLLGCPSSSAPITMTVNPVPSLGITSTDVDNVYCDGEVVDYTVTGAALYEFFVDGISQGAASATNTINSTGFGTGALELEVVGETNNCFDTSTVNITINPLPTAGLTSSVPTNAICAGETVNYTASGGVLYEFFVNGNSQGTVSPNNTFSTNTLANNDVVSVVVASATGCTDTNFFAPIGVDPFPTMTLVSSDTVICSGQLVDFTAGGATSYEFFIDGVSQGAPSPTNTLSSSTLANGDVVTVSGTSGLCTANSSPIVFVVYGFPVVDLINNGDNQLCVGEASDLEAQGASNYEFFVNGISQGAPSPVNTFNGALNNGDIVTVEGETNGCASAGNNSITFTVFNFPTLGTTTVPGTTICFGDTVTVTGSGAMTYDFDLNGVNVQSGMNTDFTTSALEDGDVITVVGFNGDCPSTPEVIPFTVNTMVLDMTVTPDAFICEGENALFTASGADEYQFFVNGVAQGAQGPTNTFASTTLADQDEVTFVGYNNTTLCEQPLNYFIIMNVIDAPTITGAPATFCEGDSVILSSNLPYGNQWVLDGTPIPGAIDSTYVATVGGDYSLDVVSGGQGDFWSVGQNATGIFGNATNFNSAVPTAANAGLTFDEIVSGFAFMLGVTTTGELYAWGENSSGQLGLGTFTGWNTPQLVPTLTNVKTAAATERSSVAVTDAGDLYVWGNNNQGQLGTGNAAVINFPFLNPNINNIDTVAGGRSHYVFLRNDGTVWTVGDNSAGQLGQGFISDSILTPVQVPGLANIVSVGAGEYNSFAISNTNELFVWGNNGSGQLGLGDLNNRVTPTLSDLENVTNVQGGAAHSLFLTSDNKVYASGNNSFGQLGTGNTNDTIRPVLIDVPGAVAISAGQYTSLVLREDASVFGFGSNVESQLSTLPQTNVTTPSHLSNLDGVTFIESSRFSSHFLYGAEQACASSVFTVTVNPTPVVTITESAGILTVTPATPGATYQWFLNGNPIVAPNPTDPSIEITAGGEYTVEVTTTEGCVGTAAYTSTLDIADLNISGVFLFPNPAQNQVTISFGVTVEATEIVVTDQTGRIVLNEIVSGDQTILDITPLSTGVYNVSVSNEEQQNTLRFVKSQQ